MMTSYTSSAMSGAGWSFLGLMWWRMILTLLF
jgi:hypothetical protein